jgi:hypothetical protein
LGGQADAPVQVVHYLVEGRQVDRLDQAHVVQRYVQALLGQPP